jgi:formate hydrogenlyase subunit 6/NADH:ubiquinone oxidoreductase subunit I
MRISYIPQVKPGKEKYCTACRRCELGCPDWCIYILDESTTEQNTQEAKT